MASEIKLGLIGGSGLGQALGAETPGTRHAVDTPFGRPSGAIVETAWHGLPVFILARHGDGHTYNPSAVPYRANVFAMKALGVTHIIASGATGSLREEFRPRDLVIPDQVIDKTHRRFGTFYEHAAVHVELAEPFCPLLRRVLISAGQPLMASQPPDAGGAPPFAVHDRGCYVCMEGPAFSTRAESLMHRLWGGDLIGMTAMPEARLAREAEIAYALIGLVTDYDCWKGRPPPRDGEAPDPFALLNEIIGHLKVATANAIALMRAAVERIASDPAAVADTPARRALQLGIWTDKARIPPAEVDRLQVLWGRYFP